jgi:hypothetical protein
VYRFPEENQPANLENDISGVESTAGYGKEEADRKIERWRIVILLQPFGQIQFHDIMPI